MQHPAIFISYRIADTLTQAGRLCQSLENELENDLREQAVFYDKSSLKPGMKWPQELTEKVRAAKVVLVLVAKKTKWLAVKYKGVSRISNEDDWVRKEIEAALSDSQKLIIPVLFNKAKLPSKEDLPESLHPLLAIQKIQIREANWDHDLMPLIKIIREHLGFVPSLPGKKDNFGFHAYTCDRDAQFDQFEDIKGGIHPGSLHFFYLYGGEMQAHKSFFQRVKHYLEGKYLESADRSMKTRGASSCRVVALDFVVDGEGCSSPERLRERFVRNLYTASGLENLDDCHPLLNQNLQNLLLASEKTRDLREGSFICVFAHISHWYWNPSLTPDAARWFMEKFCPPTLPPNSPAVLFFFAFDFNEEENPGVRDEVVEVIQHEARRVVALKELDMVERKHIAQWLVRYQRHFSAPARQQILNQHITNTEYFIDDLEPILKKLIDDYFNAHTA